MGMFFFFFFSSRRRHTRFDCDWSSDVCSSDLQPVFRDWTRRSPPSSHAPCVPAVEHLIEEGLGELVVRLARKLELNVGVVGDPRNVAFDELAQRHAPGADREALHLHQNLLWRAREDMPVACDFDAHRTSLRLPMMPHAAPDARAAA